MKTRTIRIATLTAAFVVGIAAIAYALTPSNGTLAASTAKGDRITAVITSHGSKVKIAVTCHNGPSGVDARKDNVPIKQGKFSTSLKTKSGKRFGKIHASFTEKSMADGRLTTGKCKAPNGISFHLQ